MAVRQADTPTIAQDLLTGIETTVVGSCNAIHHFGPGIRLYSVKQIQAFTLIIAIGLANAHLMQGRAGQVHMVVEFVVGEPMMDWVSVGYVLVSL